ncbi:MAG: hypothetical protein LUD15_06395 [Bacteroides sp.]|nr:hypothetical protein [Bacteroides sp.]
MKTVKESTLSPREAYEKFVSYDKEENTRAENRELLVTITLPTHHVFPDYKIDPIELKNLVNHTEKELLRFIEKKKVPVYMESIKKSPGAY